MISTIPCPAPELVAAMVSVLSAALLAVSERFELSAPSILTPPLVASMSTSSPALMSTSAAVALMLVLVAPVMSTSLAVALITTPVAPSMATSSPSRSS